MTGILNVLVALGSGGSLTGFSGTVTNTSLSTGIRTGTLALAADGTFTQTGHAVSNWFQPTTAAIGANWSAKVTINSSTTTNFTGTVGSFVSLSGGASWGMSNSSTNVEGTGTFTIAFSPDGGASTAGSMVVGWDVGYTP